MLDTIRIPICGDMQRIQSAWNRLFASDNPLLDMALRHIASRQGKMMRPMLTLLMARILTGAEATEEAIHAALALELLHTASLVHDDVVDESDRRRGQRSVNAVFDNQVAVLVGDYILSHALEQASMTDCTRFVAMMSRLGQALADGEILQLSNMDSEDITEQQYYEVIRRKTASLFAACASAVAVMLQLPSADECHRLGELIGIIFQMRDDIFDLVPDTATGKPSGNDLAEGKLTLPVIYAVQQNTALQPAALRVRRHEADTADLQSLTLAAQDCGIAYARTQMASLVQEAHAIADRLTTANADVKVKVKVKVKANVKVKVNVKVNVNAALHAYIDYAAQRNK